MKRLLPVLLVACGADPVSFEIHRPARLAQTSGLFTDLQGVVSVYNAKGRDQFPQDAEPVTTASIPIRDSVATVTIELDAGTYYADALYTDAGTTERLALLRQFTAEKFDVEGGTEPTVDLTASETIEFDADDDGTFNLVEIESATDPEDKDSFDCTLTQCRPVVIASGVPATADVVVDATHVYLLTGSYPGAVERVDRVTGTRERLLDIGKNPYFLERDDTYLYWIDLGAAIAGTGPNPTLGVLELDDPSATQVFESFRVWDLAIGATAVYFAGCLDDDPCERALHDLPKGTWAPAGTIATTPFDAEELVLDGAELYFFVPLSGGANLMKVPVDQPGAVPITVSSSPAVPREPQIDATHVYWVDQNRIYRVNKDGTDKATFFIDTDAAALLELLVEEDAVYWLRDALVGDAYELMTCDKDGLSPQRIFSDPGETMTLEGDDGLRFFWVDADQNLVSIGKRRGL